MPKRIRSLVRSLSGLMVLALLLAGCGQAAKPAAPTPAAPAPAPAPAPTPAPAPAPAPAPRVTLTLWSHWAGEQVKRDFVEGVARDYSAKNPNVEIKITWYEKSPLNTALRSAYQAGEAPDIHYIDPTPHHAVPWVDGGLIANLKGLLDESRLDPTFLSAWKYNDGVWGFPLEASGVFMWYNKKLFRDWGIEVKNDQLTWDQWQTVVRKSREAGIIPISMGVQDRSGNGWFWSGSLLGQLLGQDKSDALSSWKKTANWDDPEVLAAMQVVKRSIDDGIFPPNVLSLRLTDSYPLFFQSKAATIVIGSFVNSWVRNAPDKGGPPAGFELDVMRIPALPNAKFPDAVQIGTHGSYAVNAKSKNVKVAADFLNFMALPENGQKWVELTGVPTGIKNAVTDRSDPLVRKQLDLMARSKAVLFPHFGNRFDGAEFEAWKLGNDKLLTRDYGVDQFTKDMVAGRAKK